MAENELEITDEELLWLQTNSTKFLIKATKMGQNKKMLIALAELCDKLVTGGQLNRNDLRNMEQLTNACYKSLIEATIPEYKKRGNVKKYLQRAEEKAIMLKELLEKLTNQL